MADDAAREVARRDRRPLRVRRRARRRPGGERNAAAGTDHYRDGAVCSSSHAAGAAARTAADDADDADGHCPRSAATAARAGATTDDGARTGACAADAVRARPARPSRRTDYPPGVDVAAGHTGGDRTFRIAGRSLPARGFGAGSRRPDVDVHGRIDRRGAHVAACGHAFACARGAPIDDTQPHQRPADVQPAEGRSRLLDRARPRTRLRDRRYHPCPRAQGHQRGRVRRPGARPPARAGHLPDLPFRRAGVSRPAPRPSTSVSSRRAVPSRSRTPRASHSATTPAGSRPTPPR